MDAKRKKMIIIGAVLAAIVIALVIVLNTVCFHSWQDASCEAPMTCTKCGEIRGQALGHEWIAATCSKPKYCLNCGKTEGAALAHSWQEATCESPKLCTECGKADGEALGHKVKQWNVTKKASCAEEGERTGYCERCKKDCIEKLEKLPHTKSGWTVAKDYVITSEGTVTPGTEAIVCTVCGKQLDTREYTVQLTQSQKNAAIKAYDELNFWHCGPSFMINQILTDFNDFPLEDAKLVVPHMSVDWDEQAVLYAKENSKGASKNGLTGEMRHYGFSESQIKNALKEVGY